VGLRAEQAARERRIALRVFAALVVVAVASVLLVAAGGWAAPLLRTVGDATAGLRGSQVASPAASTSLRAALGISPSKGPAAGNGSANSMKPIRGAATAAAGAKKAAASSLRTSTGASRKVVASAKSAVSRAVGSNSTGSISQIARPAPSSAPPAASAARTSAAAAGPASRGTVTIVTFGYSFGDAPAGSRFVADVRNIDAGAFSQDETGLMQSVRDRVMATTAAKNWLETFRGQWMPALKNGDKVAIGCSRGHHRSVTLGLLFADDLRAQGFTVNLEHRDIAKSY
jgi:hypothetical protein